MRRLRTALVACALFAAPAALMAQQPAPPIGKPIPPHPGQPHPGQPHPGQPGYPGHPQPRPSGYNPSRNNNNNYTPYVYIDAAPYLATPTPKPKPKPTHHQTSNGQDVFSTYSTDNAK